MEKNIKNSIVFFFTILAMTEILPVMITMIYPKFCYGCSYIGKLHQYLNSTYNLGYIASLAHVGLLIYFIFLSTSIKNKVYKYSLIFFLLFVIYLSTLQILTLLSLFLSLFYNNPPFLENHDEIFPASRSIEKNTNNIIKEFNDYIKEYTPSCVRESNPGFKIEITKNSENCWRSLYLKNLGKIDENMVKYFPSTLPLLQDKQIHNAFFSILDPGVEIPHHVGYYKGYLRYHLGINIPNDTSNNINHKAYIVCGGKKYIWKTGEGVIFDDIYLHHVKNPSNEKRVVLYIDFIRKSNNFLCNSINDLGVFIIENSLTLHTFVKNQHNQTKIDDSKV